MSSKRRYGKGSIEKFKDGYRLHWRDGDTRKSRVVRPSTKKAAQELLADILSGNYVEPEKPAKASPEAVPEADDSSPIVTFRDLWMAHMAQQEVSVKASTYLNLQTLSRTALKPLMTKDLVEINQRVIDGWWRSQSAHPVNRRNAFFQIRKAFKLAVKWDIIPAIPFEVEKSGKDVSVKRPTWTIQDVDAVLVHLHPFYKDAVEMILSAHLRVSEFIGLNAADYADGWVSVTKQRSQRGVTSDTKYEQHKHVELLERGRIAMDARPRRIGKAALFPGERGDRMTHQALRKHWNAAVEAAGFEDFHLHDVRHIGLTLVAEVAQPVVVQERAGHASFTSTRRYLHADERQHREAVEKVNATLARLA